MSLKRFETEDNTKMNTKEEKHNRVISVRVQRWRRYMVEVVHGQYWYVLGTLYTWPVRWNVKIVVQGLQEVQSSEAKIPMKG